MFYEIAITPSVFQIDTYGSRELCEAELRGIWTELFSSLVIRDLRNGDWHKELWRNKTNCPSLAQKALKTLKVEKRLILALPSRGSSPSDSAEWCREALGSHQVQPLDGVLACRASKAAYVDEPLVCAIDQRLQPKSFWMQSINTGEKRIRRSTKGYLQALGLLLRSANHLKIMDPHLDPAAQFFFCKSSDLMRLIG
jgi:hypothetical protein